MQKVAIEMSNDICYLPQVNITWKRVSRWRHHSLQFTDWAVQVRMVYGPKRSWPIRKLHIARKYMFYFLYYASHARALCFWRADCL